MSDTMTLSQELTWRGFVSQTTYKDLQVLDGQPITFYWGVDPSADSMTIGNLATAMLVKCFIKHGHQAVLLVGGATGLIGDPDGKSEERNLKSPEEIVVNKQHLNQQYHQIFDGQPFDLVDNYDWFKDMRYLDFLRDVGKHVPLRQMLARDFVQSRLGEQAAGISYAEFSYVLIQAYDFLYLYKEKSVRLQVCGSDQWGNSIAGVDLIRRKTGGEAHVLSMPLITNKATGQKFGKTEDGAIWLDSEKTSPTQFYQFWINVDDADVETYLKVFTTWSKEEIDTIMHQHKVTPKEREAQQRLAISVTETVHGDQKAQLAERVTGVLTNPSSALQNQQLIESVIDELRKEIPSFKTSSPGSVIEALVKTRLATSNTEARRLINENAVAINGQKIDRGNFEPADFQNGRLLLRRGKASKDSALVELV